MSTTELVEASEPTPLDAPAAGGAATAGRAPGRWRDIGRQVTHSWSGRIGLAFATIIVLMAVFAPLLAPFDPTETLLNTELDEKVLERPCVHILGCSKEEVQHLMGTDANGRDVFSRIVYGGRISLIAGGASVLLAVVVGTIIGLVAGFFGRRLDNFLMRTMDVLLSFPSLLLAILIVTVLGRGLVNSVLAIAIVSVPTYARVVRAQVLTLKEQDFVTADRALGVTRPRVLFHLVFPNTLTPLVVQATLGFATAVLEIAGLGFLGLGVQPPDAEWGTMVSDGFRASILSVPYLTIFPGIMLFINVLAFNLLGDSLRDALDPRTAGRA